MLKKRLIPKLQLRKSSNSDRLVLVTTKQFNQTFEIGDPVSQAKIYEAQAADELIFLDLDASTENRDTILDIVKKCSEEIFMPFTIGGGVRNLKDFVKLLSNGADKVSINTAAVENPGLINTAANMFGAQCVVLSIDYKKEANGDYCVYIKGGKQKTNLHPVEWAIEGEKRGAGEILITSINHDGMRNGLDHEISSKIASSITIPLIISGGCGYTQHFIDGFLLGNADAVSAGTYFNFKDENPMQTRAQIRNAGIPIRLHT